MFKSKTFKETQENGYILEVDVDENDTFTVAVYKPPILSLKLNQMKFVPDQKVAHIAVHPVQTNSKEKYNSDAAFLHDRLTVNPS